MVKRINIFLIIVAIILFVYGIVLVSKPLAFEEKYGMPEGRLYLLLVDHQPAGCIGLRKIDAESCEMKRMYIRPQFRRQGLADLLVRQFIADARKIGYRRVLMDTFPFLQSAIRLYRRHGFYEIPSYNGSPMEELIYLQLDL